MLFNSHLFLLAFLPLALVGFRLLGALGGRRAAVGWLVMMSFIFYGWWNPVYLWLLGASIVVNFAIGRLMAKSCEKAPSDRVRGSKSLLIVGVGFNLALLGWYKYANFFADSANTVMAWLGQAGPLGSGEEWLHLNTIILPLAISFFTFQQIAYLADSYFGTTRNYNFLDYTLFVSFFPQLIAGPIVHHNEMLPQFDRHSGRLSVDHIAVGITILAIGLFKKVMIADTLAESASPVFRAAERGDSIDFVSAWGGVFAYTGQLYFDFSGYSDMAIGAARMFGIVLPANFNSPLKARSIIDFWNRWHMTLSRFLRDYLFFPLAGKRPTWRKRHLALFATMVLGGLWHGAGWTFVIWGALHGIFLVINHAWRYLGSRRGWGEATGLLSFAYGVLWFICFTWSLTFFRAETMGGVGTMLTGMFGFNGVALPNSFEPVFGWTRSIGIAFPVDGIVIASKAFTVVPLALLLAFLAPNSQEIMRDAAPVLGRVAKPKAFAWLRWRANVWWALFTLALLGTAIAFLTRVSEFLYFQF